MFDNRHIPYLNAIVAADIKGKAKYTLTMLIDSMDFDTCETYIGQTALAKKMGVSYDAAADGLDLLEDLKLIRMVGTRPIHPGSLKATSVYRILLEPVGTVGFLPMVTIGKKPMVGNSPSNHIQSAVGVGSGFSAKQSVEASTTHTYTHTDSLDETPYGEDQDQNQQHPPRFSEEEIGILRTLFGELTDVNPEFAEDSLRSYTGPFDSTRLAFLMFYAFRISKYWKVPSNWIALDMENFLGASRKLDGEIRKWRQHDSLVKKFPTAQAVLDKVVPPAPSGAFDIDEDAAASAGVSPLGGHVWDGERCQRCGVFFKTYAETMEDCVPVSVVTIEE